MAYTDLKSHKNKKAYFEGWYFKQSMGDFSIAIIPGVSTDMFGRHKAFIQVITNDSSEWIFYNDYYANENELFIKIGDSQFSKYGINLDFNGKKIKLKGKLIFTNMVSLSKSRYSPSIMGPFSYFSFMECYHGIESLCHFVDGKLDYNGTIISFIKGNGYIENDYGKSFPKSYIWLQGNSVSFQAECFFLSFAKIPFMGLKFKGLICVLYFNEKEYRFATYNFAKVKSFRINGNKINIIIIKKEYRLEIEAINNQSSDLIAPLKGKMDFIVKECLKGKVNLKLYNKDKMIYEKYDYRIGMECHDIENLKT